LNVEADAGATQEDKDMPSTHSVNICTNWEAEQGDAVSWTNVPATCTSANRCSISQDGNNTWPFTSPSPISIPSASTFTLKSDLATGQTYTYNVSCCSIHSVTITGK
jgi:hypothetical protein